MVSRWFGCDILWQENWMKLFSIRNFVERRKTVFEHNIWVAVSETYVVKTFLRQKMNFMLLHWQFFLLKKWVSPPLKIKWWFIWENIKPSFNLDLFGIIEGNKWEKSYFLARGKNLFPIFLVWKMFVLCEAIVNKNLLANHRATKIGNDFVVLG